MGESQKVRARIAILPVPLWRVKVDESGLGRMKRKSILP